MRANERRTRGQRGEQRHSGRRRSACCMRGGASARSPRRRRLLELRVLLAASPSAMATSDEELAIWRRRGTRRSAEVCAKGEAILEQGRLKRMKDNERARVPLRFAVCCSDQTHSMALPGTARRRCRGLWKARARKGAGNHLLQCTSSCGCRSASSGSILAFPIRRACSRSRACCSRARDASTRRVSSTRMRSARTRPSSCAHAGVCQAQG
jgi:hypothetical protein